MSHILTCEFVQIDQDGAILAANTTSVDEPGVASDAWRERVLSILDNPTAARSFLSAGPTARGWQLETRDSYEFRPIGPGEPFRFTTVTRLDYREVP